jgi:hypothetical protein
MRRSLRSIVDVIGAAPIDVEHLGVSRPLAFALRVRALCRRETSATCSSHLDAPDRYAQPPP